MTNKAAQDYHDMHRVTYALKDISDRKVLLDIIQHIEDMPPFRGLENRKLPSFASVERI